MLLLKLDHLLCKI
ncbi:unnamed protein product [Gordionus sp. m RMFG-2023]